MTYYIYFEKATKHTVTYAIRRKRSWHWDDTLVAETDDDGELEEIKELMTDTLRQTQPGVKVTFKEKK